MAETTFTVFEAETGRILRHGSCSASDVALQAGVGERVRRGAHADDLYYVRNNRIAKRQALFKGEKVALAVGQVLRVPNVPPMSIVHVNHAGYVVEDGEFEFSSDLPGVFWIAVSGVFPLQEQSIKVTVK